MTAQPKAAARRLQTAAPVFTALGDRTRLYLVTRLCEAGPQSIAALAAGTDLTRQAVTKHLRVLSNAGLARADRTGREQRWRVDPKRLAEVRRLLAQIASDWDRSLERLRTFVEDDR
ncbi:MAG: ArsR/SmtB family transcription factor [Vicinamibacterales bacterium]